METVLIYLLKVSVLLTLFYSAYLLFLKKETFFKVNRYFLLVGIIMALALPFVTITKYVEAAPIVYKILSNSPTSITQNIPIKDFDWMLVIFIIYSCGVMVLSVKFLMQLYSLYKLSEGCKVTKHGNFYHVEMDKDLAPFSFFNYIFFNPNLYSENELKAIIKHENAHSSQWHSIDVLLSHLVGIFTWVNPFSWLYQKHIKQNLEFLADESAIKEEASIKKYQYTLLRVSGNYAQTPLVNNFYNSLIKKRIVMLNKSKSNKRNILKVALILPALAVFLLSFNTENVYIPIDPVKDVLSNNEYVSELIEIIIDKNTTNKELSDIKKNLAKKGVDFSYTVVHNSKNEITDISVDFTTTKNDGKKMKSSSSFSNGDGGIDPIHIAYDENTNSISMGSKTGIQADLHEDEDILIDIHEDSDKTIWVHADSDGGSHKTIDIIDENGKETIIVNGNEVSRKEFDKMKKDNGQHERHIKIRKSHGDKDKNVFIMKDSDHDGDMDIEVISKKKDGFFFVNSDGDEKPMFVIDGKPSKEKDVKHINPSDIESMNVLKGESAEKKYGKKGKNGVIEITTKKEK